MKPLSVEMACLLIIKNKIQAVCHSSSTRRARKFANRATCKSSYILDDFLKNPTTVLAHVCKIW